MSLVASALNRKLFLVEELQDVGYRVAKIQSTVTRRISKSLSVCIVAKHLPTFKVRGATSRSSQNVEGSGVEVATGTSVATDWPHTRLDGSPEPTRQQRANPPRMDS